MRASERDVSYVTEDWSTTVRGMSEGAKKRAKRTSNRWCGASQNLKERRDTLRNDAI